MKPYYLINKSKCEMYGRRYLDCGDIGEMVAPSRFGKLKKRRARRRLLNKKSRLLAKKELKCI